MVFIFPSKECQSVLLCRFPKRGRKREVLTAFFWSNGLKIACLEEGERAVLWGIVSFPYFLSLFLIIWLYFFFGLLYVRISPFCSYTTNLKHRSK